MNPTQREKIKRQQEQMRRAQERRKSRQEALVKEQNKSKLQRNKQSKVHPANQHVAHPLPLPDDINAKDFREECFIIGGGPSLINFNWSCLSGKFTIAINRAYEVLPEAQIVYFTDDDYYQKHRDAMLKHKGKKYRGRIARKQVIKDKEVIEIQLQQRPWGWSDQYGELYHGSNSSYACIQLAAQLGFKRIHLLGVDMKHQGNYKRDKKNNKGVTHWHSGHRRTDPAHAYKMMLGHYEKLAPEAKKRGIEVINVNIPDQTTLKCFPIKSFFDVFGAKWNETNT